MWRRVLLVLVVYSTIAVLALAVPLALALGRERVQRLSESRSAAASYFADLAARRDPAVSTDLRQAVQRYEQLYGEPVLVVDRDGTPRASAGLDGVPSDVRAAVSAALRNQRSPVPESVTPWSPGSVLVAVPVGTGTQVDGAVVLVASTAAAKADVERDWWLIGLGAAGLLAVASLIAVALSRWTARPLTTLATRVTALRERVVDRAPSGTGPAVHADAGLRGPREVRTLASAFDAMAREVEASAAAQRRFVADSAHALRNPLAALRIRLDTLGLALPEASAPVHHRTTLEVDRLEGIVVDLLTLARAETPRTDPVEAADVGAVATERHEAWSAAVAAAGMSSSLDAAAGLRAGLGAGDLAQVLDVLLGNAVQHAGPGSRVRVGVRERGGDVELTVADDGRGVPQEDLARLGTRFHRAANATGPGTGLGLSIVRALAERAGGRLEVGPGPEGGLRVALLVPRAGGGAAVLRER